MFSSHSWVASLHPMCPSDLDSDGIEVLEPCSMFKQLSFQRLVSDFISNEKLYFIFIISLMMS
uniref:Uncharacterized protein n=1 Tax=Rhizophora mucronata TaxID=61149 RepID=A0A2P2MUY5_RHIMU